MTDARCWSAVK